MLCLLYLLLKCFQGLAPEVIEIRPQQRKTIRIQAIVPACARRLIAYKLRLLQNTQMLRDSRPAYRKTSRELPNWLWAATELLQKCTSREITEGIELLFVSIHLP